jgi:L-gulono-1,4-lactone dehydrogenase
MIKCSENHTFENWAKTLKFKPKNFCQPKSEQDVIDIVRAARAAKTCVRVQGGENSHSWSQFTVTNDTLVNLDNLNKPLIADILKSQFTFEAGIRIKDLVKVLAKDNLGLKNTGSIMEQSIAGAISTGTHGTGLRLGNLATQIVRMRIVTGTGDVQEITENQMPLLNAARVNFGGLGIITEVTVSVVPNYDLEFSAYWCKFEDIIDKIDTLNAENERVRIWWFPKPVFGIKHNIVLSTMNPPGTPRGMLAGFDDLTQAQSNTLAKSALPFDIGVLFAALSKLAADPDDQVLLSRFTANYVQVLTLPLIPILHRECEYAIPVEKTREALIRFRQFMDEAEFNTTLPVEVRFVAKDDSLLSPAQGRDVCYIGANTQDNAVEVFQRFEPLMKSLGGRPHWGKHFTMTRDEIRSMYPDTFQEFANLRAQWDPDGVFANSLIHQLLD